MPIRLLIADDHAIVRSGLKQILNTCADFKVVAEAADGPQTLERSRDTKLDVVLLDLTMPLLSGIDLVQKLHELRPQLAILVLSMHGAAQIAQRALRAGASGYLTKDSEPEVLIAAIRKVAEGGRFIDPGLVDAIIFDGDKLAREPHELLSDREHQVLRMIVSGLSINAIAENLHLSAKTVSTHKKRIMLKLGVSNNADLIRYAMEHKLNI